MVIYVPQYESLSLDKILEYALAFQQITNALPVLREIRKMPRAYVCNVINTLIGEEFQDWVKERCTERNEQLAIEKDLNIQLDANIAKAFQASTAVSRKSRHIFSSFVHHLLT